MKYEFLKFENMQYMITYPESYKVGEIYPVLFSIHGAGTRGNNPELLKDCLVFEKAKTTKDFPFVVVSPLCHENTWFDMYETLKRFILHIANSRFADKKRIYATGGSMGGYAVWQLGMSMPEVFAAIAPVCGGGMYWNAARLVNVPVWAFHGEKDDVVKPEESVKMVDAVNKCGGNAKLTIYPDIAHASWVPAYTNEEVYEWFLTHENKNENSIVDLYNNSKLYG